jgi:hypothetical protein
LRASRSFRPERAHRLLKKIGCAATTGKKDFSDQLIFLSKSSCRLISPFAARRRPSIAPPPRPASQLVEAGRQPPPPAFGLKPPEQAPGRGRASRSRPGRPATVDGPVVPRFLCGHSHLPAADSSVATAATHCSIAAPPPHSTGHAGAGHASAGHVVQKVYISPGTRSAPSITCLT